MSFNVKPNPKPFWKYIKSKTKFRRAVFYHETEKGNFAADENKAHVLNIAFLKVFSLKETLATAHTLFILQLQWTTGHVGHTSDT